VIGEVPGVAVGHWTDEQAQRGCTAVVFPGGATASGEVRGNAPATREWALLEPQRTVQRINAVMLCGGSAFGLAACDGAMRFCEERGRGVPTPAGVVPIVVGAAIFDLTSGDPAVRPGSDEGYAACAAAAPGPLRAERVGAGAGASIAKWRGSPRPGGLGGASLSDGELVVAALVVANAFGEPRDGAPPDLRGLETVANPLASTTIGVIATNASITKLECLLVAQAGHDGLARALEPVHTAFDGDALVAASTGGVEAPAEQVRWLAARAVEDAVRAAVE
jgi:L-aminopeptidase/D-esterase-like protein